MELQLAPFYAKVPFSHAVQWYLWSMITCMLGKDGMFIHFRLVMQSLLDDFYERQ